MGIREEVAAIQAQTVEIARIRRELERGAAAMWPDAAKTLPEGEAKPEQRQGA